jgi:Rod binding domain-containing protein
MNFTIAAQSIAHTSQTAETVQHRKLTDAAQQFEGMLLQEMLKPLKEHGFCEGENGPDDKDGGGGFADTLSSFGTESVATAIAKAGGMGIAKRVVVQVEGEKISHGRQSAGDYSSQFQNKTGTVLKSATLPPMS